MKTIIEVIVLVAVAVAIGLGIHDQRPKDSIDVERNYFPKTPLQKRVATTDYPEEVKKKEDNPQRAKDSIDVTRNYFPKTPLQKRVATTDYLEEVKEKEDNPQRAKDSIDVTWNYFSKTPFQKRAATTDYPEEVEEKEDNLGLQTVDIFTAHDYFQALDSSIVFVDARKDAAFQKGHIPGAVQFDPNNADAYIPGVLKMARYASVVIIYCNDGECVDSKNAANYLTAEIEEPLNNEQVYVFTGGIEEWCMAEYEIEGECAE